LSVGRLAAQAAIDQADLIIAPAMFTAEVANALWKYVRAGELTVAEAVDMLRAASSMCNRLEPLGDEAAVAALEGAAREDHPVYDLIYLELARREGAALATADRRLARLAEASGIEVVAA
jgi:predicted nucleic acid-binding protein